MSNNYLLPSGENNFFDYSQAHANNNGNGIDSVYPSPENIDQSSLVLDTPKVLISGVESDSIYSYNGLSGLFSNASSSQYFFQFDGLGKYIHYFPKNAKDENLNSPVYIPYISSYRVMSTYNPYGKS